MIEHNMKYEGFVRRVFGDVGRCGDPLQLANTDINDAAKRSGELSDLRLGVAYAMCRLRVRLEKEVGITGEDYETLSNLIKTVMTQTTSYDDVHKALDEAIKIANKHFPRAPDAV